MLDIGGGVHLAVAWCGNLKNESHKNGMKKGAYWEAVLTEFHDISKKKTYRNCDMLSSN